MVKYLLIGAGALCVVVAAILFLRDQAAEATVVGAAALASVERAVAKHRAAKRDKESRDAEAILTTQANATIGDPLDFLRGMRDDDLDG